MTPSRLEVITSVERRRRWSREEKERLVAATFEPGVKVSDVARTAGIHASQLFRWRKELCDRLEPGGSQLVPVEIAPAPISQTPSATAAPLSSASVEPPPSPCAPRRRVAKKSGVIEIELGGGRRIRVDRDVDGQALRRVLDVLGAR